MLKRAKHSIASSGLRRTLADLALQLANRLLRYDPETDRSFDHAHGTDTIGRIQPRDLGGVTDAGALETARVYLPSPPQVTRWMLRNVGIAHKDFTFVDLGCGKGRVLLVASEFPFRAIHGVDLSAELCAVAVRNLDVYAPKVCRNTHIHHQDATTFDFPAGPLLIHVYHSFAVELTVDLLARHEHAGPIVVAYLVYTSDVEPVKTALARLPWLRLARYEHSVTGEYDWLFYSNQ